MRSIELIDRATPTKHATLADKWKTNCAFSTRAKNYLTAISNHRFCGRPRCVHATRLNDEYTNNQQKDEVGNEIASKSRDRAFCCCVSLLSFQTFLVAVCTKRTNWKLCLSDCYATEANDGTNMLRKESIVSREKRERIKTRSTYPRMTMERRISISHDVNNNLSNIWRLHVEKSSQNIGIVFELVNKWSTRDFDATSFCH